jgi:hypothetical protein
MSESRIEVSSNEPCTDKPGVYSGVYDGWIYYFSPGGNPVPPAKIDLGRKKPNHPDTSSTVRWALDRSDIQRTAEYRPLIDRTRVAAITITRLCFRPQHTSQPAVPPHISRRQELVQNIFIAREGAETKTTHAKQPMHGSEYEFSSVNLIDGEAARAEHALVLPAYTPQSQPLPVTGAIELNVPGRRHRPVYGLLRGFEEIVHPSQLQDK